MRLLHVVSSYAPSQKQGGPIHSTQQLCEGLVTRGWDVRVLTTLEGQPTSSPVFGSTDWTEWNSVPVRYCRLTPCFGWSHELLRSLPAEVREAGIVHITGTFSIAALAAMMAARQARKPYIVSPRGSLNSWALEFKKWKKKPALKVLMPYLRRASVLHATSQSEAAELAELGIGAPISIVGNPVGVPPDVSGCERRWREELTIPDGVPMVVMLGRLHPVKGIELAIEALEVLVRARGLNVVLVLAGAGEPSYERSVMNRIRAAGLLEHVRRVGFISGGEKFDLLRQASMLLLPSWQENFGNSAVEALGVGTPVVASQNTPWKALEERGCGRWIASRGPIIAEAIEGLLKSKQQMPRVRERAMELASEFREDRIVPQMEELYAALAARTSLPFPFTGPGK